MKKLMQSLLILGIVMIFCFPAMAKKEPGNLPAPTGLECGLEGTNVCFDWIGIDGATKYSVDVEVEVDVDEVMKPNEKNEITWSITGVEKVDETQLAISMGTDPFSDPVYQIDGTNENRSGVTHTFTTDLIINSTGIHYFQASARVDGNTTSWKSDVAEVTVTDGLFVSKPKVEYFGKMTQSIEVSDVVVMDIEENRSSMGPDELEEYQCIVLNESSVMMLEEGMVWDGDSWVVEVALRPELPHLKD